MLHFLALLLRLALGGAGILLIYASFSRETEEGHVQSLLEEWWLRIDEMKKQAISRHLAFMKVLASVMTRLLDRLFGVRLLSVQSLGVSACYSFVWTGIALILLSRLNPKTQTDISHLIWLIIFGLVYGSLPAFEYGSNWKFLRLKFVHVWFAGLLFVFVWNFLDPFGYIILYGVVTPGMRKGALVLSAIVVGFAFAVFLFAVFTNIMRMTLRTIARTQSPLKIVGLSLLNIAPIVTFYGLVKLLFSWPDSSSVLNSAALTVMLVLVFCGMLFNFAFILSAVLFVCLAILMLVHRLFWPAIDRPLYKLQALGIAKRPKVFAAIGVILLGASFGKHEWLWFIIDKL